MSVSIATHSGGWLGGGRRSVLILVGIVLAHLPALFLPSINLEFAFVDAARYFAGGDRVLLDQYFHFQANSLGFPWAGRLVMAALPPDAGLFALRAISLSGVVLLWAGLRTLARQGARPDTDAVLILVLLNPLVWTFSTRATADFFPAALAVFAVSLVADPRRALVRSLLAGLLLGAAAVMKYHALAVALYVVVLSGAGPLARASVKSWLVVAAIASTMLAGYLWAAHEAFGFWFAPPLYRDVHRFTPSALPGNFIGYAGYLVLLTAPVSALVPGAATVAARHWRAIAAGTIGLLLTGAALLDVQGEMGLGPLDRFLDRRVTGGMFLVLCAAVLMPLMRGSFGDATADRRRRLILPATMAVLTGLALTRPAQRYLLFLIPFHVLALPIDLARVRSVVVATGLVYASLDGFVAYSQWCTGTAARQMADRIDAAGLLPVTDPGDLASHVGDRFFQQAGPSVQPSYVVRAGRLEGAAITVTSGATFLPRSYSLMALPPGTAGAADPLPRSGTGYIQK